MKPISLLLFVAATSLAAEPAIDFNRDVRPILSDKCFACHGPDEKHRAAKLRLDVEKDAQRAIKVEFLDRISSKDETERMPPKKANKPLTAKEIATLQRWVAEGAKWSAHWAYVTPKKTIEPHVKSAWPINWIDRFLYVRMRQEKVEPSSDANAVTLIRRLYFDLTGLPPSPADIATFKDSVLSTQFSVLVDKLLASEHFGERMAMYWLDLVRYADTVGYHGDQDHHASPYRDYVIDAFNLNLRFDRFTREQLAGDLLPESGVDQKIATCYNRLLQTSHEGGVQAKEYLAIYAADRVRNVSAVWMGATVGCAQCHNHKFDPYTAKDFYALSAFFADVDEEKHLRGGGADAIPTKRAPEIPVLIRKDRLVYEDSQRRLDRAKKSLAEAIEGRKKGIDGTNEQKRKVDMAYLEEIELQTTTIKALETQIAYYKMRIRPIMVTQAVMPRTTRILPRGNWLDETGEVVQPAIPAFLGKILGDKRSTRLDLANWLTDSKNGVGGLTARVFVNRLWYLFFGVGLSKSLEDFGGQGEPPVHPELLDNLAIEFIESGWDVKHMVKLIVSSRAYRQSSLATQELREKDPENRLYARQSSFRLPAESIRDNALAVSGLLVLEVGGSSAKPYQPAGFYRHLNFPKREYASDKDVKQWRRGVYVHWQRQYLHPMLRAFDAPTREECTAQRPRSNTPLAALVLLNDPTFIECARVFGQRILGWAAKSDEERVTLSFREATSRNPDDAERGVLLKLLNASRTRYKADAKAAQDMVAIGQSPVAKALDVVELAAWTSVCRAVLNLNEVVTRE